VSESQLVVSLLIQLFLDVFAVQLRAAMTSFMFVCPSIRPSVRMNNPRPTGRIFVKFSTGIFLLIYIKLFSLVRSLVSMFAGAPMATVAALITKVTDVPMVTFVTKVNNVAITSIPTITLIDKVTNMGR